MGLRGKPEVAGSPGPRPALPPPLPFLYLADAFALVSCKPVAVSIAALPFCFKLWILLKALPKTIPAKPERAPREHLTVVLNLQGLCFYLQDGFLSKLFSVGASAHRKLLENMQFRPTLT